MRSCFSQKYQEHRKESTDALSENFQCELVYVDLLRFLWLMLCFKTRAIIKEKYKLFITLADRWSPNKSQHNVYHSFFFTVVGGRRQSNKSSGMVVGKIRWDGEH